MKRERRVEEKFCDENKRKRAINNKLEECKTFWLNVTVSVCNLLSSPCPFSTSAFWDVSRSYITTSPLLNDTTMWAGSQPLKSTDVGTPCSTNTNTRQLDRLQFLLWPVGGGGVFPTFTFVCVESADAGVLFCWVPQFDRSIG